VHRQLLQEYTDEFYIFGVLKKSFFFSPKKMSVAGQLLTIRDERLAEDHP
jgi:hypothetical protein